MNTKSMTAIFHISPSPRMRVLMFTMVIGLGSIPAQAAILFYTSIDEEEAGFNQAVADEGLVLLGRESFGSVAVGQSGTTPSGLIAPGFPAGPLLPSGTDILLGLLFQTNELGSEPVTLDQGDVFYVSGPVAEGERTWIGPNLASNSIDVIIDPPDYRGQTKAISFAISASGGSDIVAKVYDANNVLVSSFTTASGSVDRLGIVSSSDALFRVNLHASTGFLDISEVDVYTVVPEPAASAAAAAGLVLVMGLLRRRRSRA